MDKFLNGHFYNPTKGNLKLDQVIEEIFAYLQEKPEKIYEIVVGCDSSSGLDPYFPVAIVVLRKGEGGRFFLKKIHYNSQEKKRFKNWKLRILQEVMLSCELALSLKETFNHQNGIDNYRFRYIHADVGENGATKDMIKEVIGLIRGNGFEPVIKPQSFVASNVADRYS